MLTYSIAIRTLGASGDAFRDELLSVAAQTVQPRRVLVYIAEGYARPDFTVGREEYIWVKKGMVAQRILPYDEISSDVIFMLDDDVCLATDSAERMLAAMEEYGADCVGADTFRNQDMTLGRKIYAAVVNLVFPHRDKKWAFKIRSDGSFSYNCRPGKNFLLSQSCAGNAMMWRKSVYECLHLEDELWLDEFPFAYGDDMIESYKVYKNGFRLGVLYDSGVEHIDVRSASDAFRKDTEWMHARTMSLFVVWWRTIFEATSKCSADRVFSVFCFAVKIFWLFLVVCCMSVIKFRPRYVREYVHGLTEGWSFVHSKKYLIRGSYILQGSNTR